MLPQKLDLGRNQEQSSMNRYSQKFDNLSYSSAVRGRSNTYANSLINEALAICGHPHYKMSGRKWSREALDFLKKFS